MQPDGSYNGKIYYTIIIYTFLKVIILEILCKLLAIHHHYPITIVLILFILYIIYNL